MSTHSSRHLIAYRIFHVLAVLAVFICAGYLTAFKGWVLFYAGPLLLVAFFIVLYQHMRLQIQFGQGVASSRAMIWAAVQLLSLLIAYIFLPGMSDTDTVLMFASVEVNRTDTLVTISNYLSFTGSIVFFVATVLLGRTLKRHRTEQI